MNHGCSLCLLRPSLARSSTVSSQDAGPGGAKEPLSQPQEVEVPYGSAGQAAEGSSSRQIPQRLRFQAQAGLYGLPAATF